MLLQRVTYTLSQDSETTLQKLKLVDLQFDSFTKQKFNSLGLTGLMLDLTN